VTNAKEENLIVFQLMEIVKVLQRLSNKQVVTPLFIVNSQAKIERDKNGEGNSSLLLEKWQYQTDG